MSDYFIGGRVTGVDLSKLSIQDVAALKQTELLFDMRSEFRKMNFLLELISGVEIDKESFDGDN